MNLINELITHKVFGEGNIVNHEESIITVDFNEEIKKFVYPDAFRKFITLNDQSTAKTFKEIFLKREKEEEALELKREEEKEQQALEQQRKEKLKNHSIHESSQIVFWLDEEEQQNVFVDWQVSTGKVQSGKNEGQPNRAARVSPNSAGLLTARGSDQPETDRMILGLYMVNEMFSDNLSDGGMVPSHAEFRIELTDQEAEQMLFWNYYINKNYPQRTSWNSGKFRYFDNIWTAQILKDIIALKTDEEQIKEAQNFLEYFCQMNALDMDNIPEASGALKQ
ncbi:malate synthase [Sporosarcina sp. G11-34]|uniref:malate synthase n=1 Tax=Sporosarcina sp. G11-34 TaxID=2849605 RepID=UPI0022A960C4|nr:malate synthase [Sporosarcina sp. G11-34]MCZ2259907.1 malate synthase [Sporosarcina sp. G11-34]